MHDFAPPTISTTYAFVAKPFVSLSFLGLVDARNSTAQSPPSVLVLRRLDCGFESPPWSLSKGTLLVERLRKRGVRPMKSLARVNLCAGAPDPGAYRERPFAY